MNFKLIISVIILGAGSQSIFGGSLLSRGPRPVEEQVVVEQQPEVIAPVLVQEQKEEVQVAEAADVQPSQVQEATSAEIPSGKQHAEVKSDTQILERILTFIKNNQRGDHQNQTNDERSRKYHACNLANFIYAAQHEPTTSELKLIPLLKNQGDLYLLAEIQARLNYCNDHDNDWRRDNYWRVFYHIKAIADYLNWRPEDTIQAGRAFLSHLLALHAARKPMAKIDDKLSFNK